MGMYKSFKTDVKSEQTGIIIDYGDFRVNLARAGGANKRYQKIMEFKSRPHQRAIKTGNFSNERSMELLREAYAESVILGWETKVDGDYVVGIENSEGGDLLPVTPANILLTFNKLPDLFADIMEQAQSSALFRSELLEEAAKNSLSV